MSTTTTEDGWPQQRRAALRQAVGVGVASGTYGVSFGALATAGGLSVVQACATSVLMFTGASQFALVGILADGGSGVSATATAVLLGTRNGLYGLRLSSVLGLRPLARIVGAQLVIDESTAVSVAQRTERGQRLGFWAAGLSVFLLWNASTLIGALVGNALGDPARYGLDAAAPAALMALAAPRVRGSRAWLTAALAVAVALALLPASAAGVPVLVAAGAALVLGLPRRAPGGAP